MLSSRPDVRLVVGHQPLKAIRPAYVRFALIAIGLLRRSGPPLSARSGGAQQRSSPVAIGAKRT
jgi:hypothetical protein